MYNIMKGSDIIIKNLIDHKVKHVFGLIGIQNEPLIDGLYKQDSLKYISARQEQAAGFMACGYSKVYGNPGVCTVVTGPGLMNIIPGIADAFIVSGPFIVIVGGKDSIN
jgi:acetolactate synthase-1/2/3 large subunit